MTWHTKLFAFLSNANPNLLPVFTLRRGSIKTGIILGALEQPEMARELQKEFATELRTEFKDLRVRIYI